MFVYPLKARKKDIYQLSSPAVLLDWQVDWFDYGRHQEDGGWNPEGAGGGKDAFGRLMLCCLAVGLSVGELTQAMSCPPLVCVWAIPDGHSSSFSDSPAQTHALRASAHSGVSSWKWLHDDYFWCHWIQNVHPWPALYSVPYPLHKVPFSPFLPLVS